MLVSIVTVGYSTERAEKHTLDDPRTITLDLRNRRGTGSLGDLDRAHYDPNIVSDCLVHWLIDSPEFYTWHAMSVETTVTGIKLISHRVQCGATLIKHTSVKLSHIACIN